MSGLCLCTAMVAIIIMRMLALVISTCRVAFKDQQNSQITDKLIREVKAANPAFQSGLIGSVYYESL